MKVVQVHQQSGAMHTSEEEPQVRTALKVRRCSECALPSNCGNSRPKVPDILISLLFSVTVTAYVCSSDGEIVALEHLIGSEV